ncbi:MAG: ABC transporter ATP-binding protein [Simkaniaceae bacterium]
MEPKNTAVVCKGIKKTYGEKATAVQALKGIDLEVNVGEMLMIVGPSGSGKTTLISIMAGILHQDEGSCLVFGSDLKQMTDKDRTIFRGRHIGFIFQQFHLIPMLNAEENVSVPLLFNGEERNNALSKARDILIHLGLKSKLKSFPPNLSGGEQQRLAIARSYIHSPELIVCDEPTSYLDIESGKRVLSILRALVQRENRSIVVVTHDARIFPFADRIIHLEDGKIVSEQRNHQEGGIH